MPRKRHKPEEIVAKLRQVDVLVSQGQSVADAIRSIGVTEVTYCRWRQEFGGLKTEQIKRLKVSAVSVPWLVEPQSSCSTHRSRPSRWWKFDGR